MGTSADRSAGKGGNWTPLKHAANTYIRGLNRNDSAARARRLLALSVPLLGGPAAAASTARAGTASIGRLGAFLGGVGANGVQPTLEALQLGHLVGQDRFVVLDELVTFIAGEGNDLDTQAARDAVCEIVEEVFGPADAWAELAAIGVDETQLQHLLERFLTLYIYNRLPVVAERLSQMADPAAMRRADLEMHQIISDLVSISLPDNPLTIDWRGAAGRAIAEQAMASAYQALSALD